MFIDSTCTAFECRFNGKERSSHWKLPSTVGSRWTVWQACYDVSGRILFLTVLAEGVGDHSLLVIAYDAKQAQLTNADWRKNPLRVWLSYMPSARELEYPCSTVTLSDFYLCCGSKQKGGSTIYRMKLGIAAEELLTVSAKGDDFVNVAELALIWHCSSYQPVHITVSPAYPSQCYVDKMQDQENSVAVFDTSSCNGEWAYIQTLPMALRRCDGESMFSVNKQLWIYNNHNLSIRVWEWGFE